MLSKLFENIRLGIELWFTILSIVFISGQYFLLGIPEIGLPFSVSIGSLWVFIIMALLFILINIGFHKVFTTSFEVFKRNFFLPIISLAVLNWIWPVYNFNNLSLLLALLIVYSNFYRISETESKLVNPYLINIGIVAFLMFLISPAAIIILILSMIHTSLQGVKGWRHLAIPIYTFLFSLGCFYMLAVSFDFLPDFMAKINSLTPRFVSFDILYEKRIVLFSAIVLFLFGLMEYRTFLTQAPVAKRKVMGLLTWQFLLSLAGWFLYEMNDTFILLALMSVSVLFANHFQFIKKRWIREVWLWVLIVMAFVPFIWNL